MIRKLKKKSEKHHLFTIATNNNNKKYYGITLTKKEKDFSTKTLILEERSCYGLIQVVRESLL